MTEPLNEPNVPITSLDFRMTRADFYGYGSPGWRFTIINGLGLRLIDVCVDWDWTEVMTREEWETEMQSYARIPRTDY